MQLPTVGMPAEDPFDDLSRATRCVTISDTINKVRRRVQSMATAAFALNPRGRVVCLLKSTSG